MLVNSKLKPVTKVQKQESKRNLRLQQEDVTSQQASISYLPKKEKSAATQHRRVRVFLQNARNAGFGSANIISKPILLILILTDFRCWAFIPKGIKIQEHIVIPVGRYKLASVIKSYLDSILATREALRNSYVMKQLRNSEEDIHVGRVRSVTEFIKDL